MTKSRTDLRTYPDRQRQRRRIPVFDFAGTLCGVARVRRRIDRVRFGD
jgi:hypothetical protein